MALDSMQAQSRLLGRDRVSSSREGSNGWTSIASTAFRLTAESSPVGYHVRGEERGRMAAKKRNRLFEDLLVYIYELHEPGAGYYPRTTQGPCIPQLPKGYGMIECRARVARAKPHLRPVSRVHPSEVRASEIGRANGHFVQGVPFRPDSRRSPSQWTSLRMPFAELVKCTFHARIQASATSS